MNTSANFTAEEQYDYRESQKDFWDLNNVIDTAEKKGFAKGEKTGFEKGIIEGVIESARNMIKAGVDKQTVINALNLTPEIIKEL